MPEVPAEPMTGAEWLARTIHATGTTHVFWVDAVLRRTLIELGVRQAARAGKTETTGRSGAKAPRAGGSRRPTKPTPPNDPSLA